MCVKYLKLLLVGCIFFTSCSAKNVEIDAKKLTENMQILGNNDVAIAEAFKGVVSRIEVLEKKAGIVRPTPTPKK
jgi:hypothetical protein